MQSTGGDVMIKLRAADERKRWGGGKYNYYICCGEMHNVSTRPDVEKRARLIVVALNAIRFSRFNSFIAFLHDLNSYLSQASFAI
jgi:hypothetical protein